MSNYIATCANKPLFAAYTRLTADVWARKLQDNPNATPQKNISYNSFVDLLNRQEPFNKTYIRPVSQLQVNISNTCTKINNNISFENEVMCIIEKAYNQGIVNYENNLIYATEYQYNNEPLQGNVKHKMRPIYTSNNSFSTKV